MMLSAYRITVEDLNDGSANVLSRFWAGRRGVFLVRQPHDQLALLISVERAPYTGEVTRILGQLSFDAERMLEFSCFVEEARRLSA